jgi:F420-dependent oxidoreductase-like protein
MAVNELVGISLHERTTQEQLALIERAEQLGVASAWLTTGLDLDSMALFTAAAMRTSRIVLGTAVVPTFTRHPLVLVQEARVVADLAPGRLRLGVGPSHKVRMEEQFGVEFVRPLEHLREYVAVLRAALHQGQVDFDGSRIVAHLSTPNPPKVPILISALRPRSFRLAGEISDGALAWVCPASYLREQALPALLEGAAASARPAPPLIAHCCLAVTDDLDAARIAARDQVARRLDRAEFRHMFAQAGYSETLEGSTSDALVDEVVVYGDEATTRQRLRAFLGGGIDGVITSLFVVGPDRRESLERSMRVVASL